MSIAALITQGIGPGGSVKYLLTGGLDIGAALEGVRPLYDTTTALTITLASLATSAGLIAGRQSTLVDNTALLATDVLVQGKITTGTSPTAGRIEIWAIGGDGSNNTAGAGASDAAFTPTGEKTLMRRLAFIPTDTTNDHTYEFGPVSLAAAFRQLMPKSFGVAVFHNTGVNLNSTAGNHEIKYSPVNWEIPA